MEQINFSFSFTIINLLIIGGKYGDTNPRE